MTKTDEYFGFEAFAVLPLFWGIVTLQTKRQVNNQNSTLTHKTYKSYILRSQIIIALLHNKGVSRERVCTEVYDDVVICLNS